MKSTRRRATIPIKRIRPVLIVLAIGAAYYIIYTQFGIGLVCPIYALFGVYCPGCGITRMFVHLSKFEFYEAFKSNELLFVMLPVLLVVYAIRKKISKTIYNAILWAFVVLLVLFGIFHNISA